MFDIYDQRCLFPQGCMCNFISNSVKTLNLPANTIIMVFNFMKCKINICKQFVYVVTSMLKKRINATLIEHLSK